MDTLGWSLTGAAIYVVVALAIPLVVSLFDRPADSGDAHLLVGLSWAWPVLGPLFMAAILIATPFILLDKYSSWLIKPKVEYPEGKPVEGKVVE